MLPPDREVLELTSKVCLGVSSDRAEDSASLSSAEMEFESVTSVCSSRDDKTQGDTRGGVSCSGQITTGLATGAGDTKALKFR